MAEIIEKDRQPYKIWDKANGIWNRLNFLSNAKSIDADDGNNLQTKVGAINGITTDVACEDPTVAASITTVSKLNNALADGKVKFQVTTEGKLQYSVYTEGSV